MAGKVTRISTRRALRGGGDAVAAAAADYRAGAAIRFPTGFEFPLFDGRGRRLSEAELLEARSASAPWADAGDYPRVFSALGCSAVALFDQSSSAGDWGFLVKRGGVWLMASQENCSPGGDGFAYALGIDDVRVDDCVLGEPELARAVASVIAERDPGYLKES